MGSSDITNVYAALDRTHTVVALERSRRGDEGFRTFYDEFADYAADKGYIPYLLLLNFHVDDGSRLPPIEAKERSYRLAHLAPLEVKDIRQALTLYDLLYCRKHGLDPLAAQNTARNLCYKDDYAGFRNESIPVLKQPGAPYGAVETEGGVALFRRGEQPADSAQRGPALQHIVRLHDAAFCWQMNIFHLSSEVKLEQLRHHDGYERAMFYLGKGMKQLSKFGTLTAAKTRWELLLSTDTPLGTGCYEEM